MELKQNTVLITGGSSGIGLEIAKQLVAKGNKVLVTGRKSEQLKAAKSEVSEIYTIQSDVSKTDDIANLAQLIKKDFPELNMLINNAGVMFKVDLQNHDMSPEALTAEIDINLKGTIWMNDAFIPILKQNNGATIVNVTSGLAFAPLPVSSIYCATKAALHSYSISLRAQLNNTNIKVVELAPPGTKTKILDHFSDEELEGNSVMTCEAMVGAFLKGLEKDNLEICPGQAGQLRFMSRFFPSFINKQLAKPVDLMHAKK